MTILKNNKACGRAGLGLILLLFAASFAVAERADREKPINLEADRVLLDDAKRLSTYEGNVQLSQGTLLIRSDKLIVSEDAQGFQYGIAHGNPAYFRQKREGHDDFVEGFAGRIEYDGKQEKVQLFTQARMKRDQDEVRGDYISYDIKTEFYKVLGGGAKAGNANNPQGRVRVVILPKKKPGAANPGSSNLTPAETIANPRDQ